jgi:hypothetical protein
MIFGSRINRAELCTAIRTRLNDQQGGYREGFDVIQRKTRVIQRKTR